ncbi:MAG: hypothetical protein RI935_588 [Candidatus Parcubacteria bacterium]|jgi:hypothetical protein
MYSLSIDYLFNRIYDVLLWIKYTWLFVIKREDVDAYIKSVEANDWDGLRDRGWLTETTSTLPVPEAEVHVSLWQRLQEAVGLKVRDSDRDGAPDVVDPRPYDSDNLSKSDIKERYEEYYSFSDHVRDIFGISPKDSDKDSVPDSYEKVINTDKDNPDTDNDGLLDGQELAKGTDPLNPDTDGDLVLDGRDEDPLNSFVSSLGEDSDKDGVSDKMESFLGSDSTKIDTDGDGITDGMDTYILDPENISNGLLGKIAENGNDLLFAIQNPVIHFMSNVLGLFIIAIMCCLVYASVRWFSVFLEGLNHYEHHFHHDDHSHSPHHVISHTQDVSSHHGHAIDNLPVGEVKSVETYSLAEEQNNHPKFAIIEGYMNSETETLWRIGVMEADNLLHEVLREKGYQGETLGEMLKAASFRTIDLAWDAHKIRNRIAHEGLDFQLTEREAKRAFVLYESVFRDLKVIR